MKNKRGPDGLVGAPLAYRRRRPSDPAPILSADQPAKERLAAALSRCYRQARNVTEPDEALLALAEHVGVLVPEEQPPRTAPDRERTGTAR